METQPPISPYASKAIFIVHRDPEKTGALTRAFEELALPNSFRFFPDENTLLRHMLRYGQGASAHPPALIILAHPKPSILTYALLKKFHLDPFLRYIPIVILFDAPDEEDTRRCCDLGASCCLGKPESSIQLREMLRTICAYWLKYAVLPRTDEPLRQIHRLL
jgi:CheY-like chemotaxis protein